MQIKISSEVASRRIEYYTNDSKALRYFHRKKLYTIRDCMALQNELMPKYWYPLKQTVLREVLQVKPISDGHV